MHSELELVQREQGFWPSHLRCLPRCWDCQQVEHCIRRARHESRGNIHKQDRLLGQRECWRETLSQQKATPMGMPCDRGRGSVSWERRNWMVGLRGWRRHRLCRHWKALAEARLRRPLWEDTRCRGYSAGRRKTCRAKLMMKEDMYRMEMRNKK